MVAEDAGEDADACRSSPTSSSDLLANAPQLKITINRDQAARFGISPQLIDDTLNDAFGQRQITQYFTQLKTYFVILEILPDQQTDLATLDRIYVKSPLTGGAVPLSSLVDVDTSKVGPLSVAHQGQFPAVTLSFNLQPGVALGQAVDAINAGRARNRHAVVDHSDLPGQRAGVPELAVERADPDRRGAGRRLHHPRHAV